MVARVNVTTHWPDPIRFRIVSVCIYGTKKFSQARLETIAVSLNIDTIMLCHIAVAYRAAFTQHGYRDE